MFLYFSLFCYGNLINRLFSCDPVVISVNWLSISFSFFCLLILGFHLQILDRANFAFIDALCSYED